MQYGARYNFLFVNFHCRAISGDVSISTPIVHARVSALSPGLNASVQRLEDNTRRYRKSPLRVEAFPVCLPEVRALRSPWATGFTNLLNGMVPDGVDLDVDIRERILTGSECPRGQGPGRTARNTHFQRPLLCKSRTSGSMSWDSGLHSGGESVFGAKAQDGLRGTHSAQKVSDLMRVS